MSGRSALHNLRHETGKFKVISPNGFIFQVTCRKRGGVRIHQIGEVKSAMLTRLTRWQIERLND